VPKRAHAPGVRREAARNLLAYPSRHGDQQGNGGVLEQSEFTFDGQKFNASHDEPYWIVQTEKTGAKAAHKESSLTVR
jgi:hypothetical protein